MDEGLGLFHRFRQIVCDALGSKALPRVAAVAKRLLRGMTAAAQADAFAPGQTVFATGSVMNTEIALDEYGAVV